MHYGFMLRYPAMLFGEFDDCGGHEEDSEDEDSSEDDDDEDSEECDDDDEGGANSDEAETVANRLRELSSGNFAESWRVAIAYHPKTVAMTRSIPHAPCRTRLPPMVVSFFTNYDLRPLHSSHTAFSRIKCGIKEPKREPSNADVDRLIGVLRGVQYDAAELSATQYLGWYLDAANADWLVRSEDGEWDRTIESYDDESDR